MSQNDRKYHKARAIAATLMLPVLIVAFSAWLGRTVERWEVVAAAVSLVASAVAVIVMCAPQKQYARMARLLAMDIMLGIILYLLFFVLRAPAP